MDTTADNSLGNVIAANSISVFLGSCGIFRVIFYIYFLYICARSGLGLPWLVASIYWEISDPAVGFVVQVL